MCEACNRWAKKGSAAASHDNGSNGETGYSAATLRSLAAADEALLNYDLLEALVGTVVGRVQGAILIFMPGAPEISRLVRLPMHHRLSPAWLQFTGVDKLLACQAKVQS